MIIHRAMKDEGMKQVNKREWTDWCNSQGASMSCSHAHEPPLATGMINGEVVAYARLWDGSEYHQGRGAEWLLPQSGDNVATEGDEV